MSIRLQKFLADAGVASRRQSETLIKSGKIFVNGRKAVIGDRIDPDVDQITVAGKPVKQKSKIRYMMLNKPIGVASTVSDPHNPKTVLDLVTSKERLFPVGRLDKNSEGLMLLTNDGELAYRLTHPKFEIEKTYDVLIDGNLSTKDLSKLETGILLEDGMTAPCKARRKTNGWIELKLHEGKKREIRRMMSKLGYNVKTLRRIAIGPLELGNLPLGKNRELTFSEISALKKSVKLI